MNASHTPPERDAEEAPVTIWLRRLEAGDQRAAQPLWDHFCSRLLDLARSRLPGRVRTGYDEDDVTLSSFQSLFHGIARRQFDLRDRTDLWRLLLVIAERKILKRVRDECRNRRDVRRIVHESVFLPVRPVEEGEGLAGLDSLEGRDPTPELAVQVSEACDALLESLADDSLRRIALLKLENHTSEEIAAQLNCTRRTVHRKLLVIRETWRDAAGLKAETDVVSHSEAEGA